MPAPLPLDPIAEAHRQWVAHGWGEVADGMAAVTSVMRAQQIMMAREDIYGKGFAAYCSQYPLVRDFSLINQSPFINEQPLDPEQLAKIL